MSACRGKRDPSTEIERGNQLDKARKEKGTKAPRNLGCQIMEHIITGATKGAIGAGENGRMRWVMMVKKAAKCFRSSMKNRKKGNEKEWPQTSSRCQSSFFEHRLGWGIVVEETRGNNCPGIDRKVKGEEGTRAVESGIKDREREATLAASRK